MSRREREFHDDPDPLDGPRCPDCGAWWEEGCSCPEYTEADHAADEADMRHSDGEVDQ